MTSKPQILYQYWTWDKCMLDLFSGIFYLMPIERKTHEIILSEFSKEWKLSTMASFYVTYAMCSYSLNASITSILLIPLTTLNPQNIFYHFTGFILSNLDLYFAITHHSISTVYLWLIYNQVIFMNYVPLFKFICTLWDPL